GLLRSRVKIHDVLAGVQNAIPPHPCRRPTGHPAYRIETDAVPADANEIAIAFHDSERLYARLHANGNVCVRAAADTLALGVIIDQHFSAVNRAKGLRACDLDLAHHVLAQKHSIFSEP